MPPPVVIDSRHDRLLLVFAQILSVQISRAGSDPTWCVFKRKRLLGYFSAILLGGEQIAFRVNASTMHDRCRVRRAQPPGPVKTAPRHRCQASQWRICVSAGRSRLPLSGCAPARDAMAGGSLAGLLQSSRALQACRTAATKRSRKCAIRCWSHVLTAD
jgi:hypothetical protein